jgi:hypothetical protein
VLNVDRYLGKIRPPHPRSSGCGDGACVLCQYNPSRICKRNLKQKYLIDDHLRAKCNAGLRVEVCCRRGESAGTRAEGAVPLGAAAPFQGCCARVKVFRVCEGVRGYCKAARPRFCIIKGWQSRGGLSACATPKAIVAAHPCPLM